MWVTTCGRAPEVVRGLPPSAAPAWAAIATVPITIPAATIRRRQKVAADRLLRLVVTGGRRGAAEPGRTPTQRLGVSTGYMTAAISNSLLIHRSCFTRVVISSVCFDREDRTTGVRHSTLVERAFGVKGNVERVFATNA
jgi:hypothetical protein